MLNHIVRQDVRLKRSRTWFPRQWSHPREAPHESNSLAARVCLATADALLLRGWRCFSKDEQLGDGLQSRVPRQLTTSRHRAPSLMVATLSIWSHLSQPWWCSWGSYRHWKDRNCQRCWPASVSIVLTTHRWARCSKDWPRAVPGRDSLLVLRWVQPYRARGTLCRPAARVQSINVWVRLQAGPATQTHL